MSSVFVKKDQTELCVADKEETHDDGKKFVALRVSDTQIASIKTFSRFIEILDLSRNPVGNHVLAELKSLPLRVLHLSDINLSGDIVLSCWTLLVDFTATDNKLTSVDARKTKLRALRVSRNMIMEITLDNEQMFEKLHVDDNCIENLTFLRKAKIVELKIGGNRFTKLDPAVFTPSSATLKKIDLRDHRLREFPNSSNFPNVDKLIFYSRYSNLQAPDNLKSKLDEYSKPGAASEMFNYFRARVFGQDEAIDDIVQVLAAWKKDEPLVILIPGPPGVGKTEFCTFLARYYQPTKALLTGVVTDNVDAFDADGRLAVADGGNGDLELGRHHLMTHIPCGQYQTLESLTTLLGAPKTYKGDDGVLFKAATHAEDRVVVTLLDEFDLGHDKLRDTLYDAFTSGKITSQRSGRTVVAKQMIFLLTSNVAADIFVAKSRELKAMLRSDRIAQIREIIERAVDAKRQQPAFLPAQLSRMKAIVPMSNICQHERERIFEKKIGHMIESYVTDNVLVVVDPKAKDAMIAKVPPGVNGRSIGGASLALSDLTQTITAKIAPQRVDNSQEVAVSIEINKVGVFDVRASSATDAQKGDIATKRKAISDYKSRCAEAKKIRDKQLTPSVYVQVEYAWNSMTNRSVKFIVGMVPLSDYDVLRRKICVAMVKLAMPPFDGVPDGAPNKAKWYRQWRIVDESGETLLPTDFGEFKTLAMRESSVLLAPPVMEYETFTAPNKN